MGKLNKVFGIKKHETDVNNLLTKINEFHSDETVKEVKKVANSLKHHADIYIKDLEAQPDYIISSYQGFTSSATANKGLDIDESALLLQNMHKKIIELARFLHTYINFDKAFELEEEGIIHLDRQKEKATYKKFCINDY